MVTEVYGRIGKEEEIAGCLVIARVPFILKITYPSIDIIPFHTISFGKWIVETGKYTY